jgi:hypothetical protein
VPGQESFADFDSIWNEMPQFQDPIVYDPDEAIFQEVNPAIQSTFQDFLHASVSAQPMNLITLHPADIQFSQVERLKIRDRSAALARHFCSDPTAEKHMEHQLSTLFSTLGLSQQEAIEALHQDRLAGWLFLSKNPRR